METSLCAPDNPPHGGLKSRCPVGAVEGGRLLTAGLSAMSGTVHGGGLRLV